MDNATMAYLQSLPPAERQAAMMRLTGQEPQMKGSAADIASVMGIGETNDQITDAEKAMARAQALRGTEFAQGRAAGGVYTAANPLEQAAVLVDRLAGGLQAKDAQAKLDALRGERTGKRTKKYLMQYGDTLTPEAPPPPNQTPLGDGEI